MSSWNLLWKGNVDAAGLCQTSMACHSFHPSLWAFIAPWMSRMRLSLLKTNHKVIHGSTWLSAARLSVMRRKSTLEPLKNSPSRYKYSPRSRLAESTSPALILRHSYPAGLLPRQTRERDFKANIQQDFYERSCCPWSRDSSSMGGHMPGFESVIRHVAPIHDFISRVLWARMQGWYLLRKAWVAIHRDQRNTWIRTR